MHEATPPRSDAAAGAWARPAAAGVIAIVAAIVLSTFQDHGIGWDEELHVAYGDKLLAYYASGLRDRSAFSFVNLYYYGGFFDLTAALATLILPFDVYETRHLLGGVMMLAGLLGVWRLARLLAGDRAAAIAVAAAATTPLLFGHSFINPKDAPLAWLSVWVAYFACRLLDHDRPPSHRVVFGLGISLGLALGTRIIAFAFIAQIAVVLGIQFFARQMHGGAARTEDWRPARAFALALPIAFGVMAVFWPWSVQEPLNVVAAFRELAGLGWNPEMVWMGDVVHGPDLPRSYFVVLFGVQLPEYVLIGLVAAAIGVVKEARVARARDAAALRILFVALTVIVPLAAFALVRPSTYNGVRHFLFLTPHIIILSAIGLDRAIAVLSRAQAGLGVALGAGLILAMARQAAIMIDIHPYQYLAYNALAGDVSGAYGRFELDYWGVSYREAARDMMVVIGREPAPATVAPLRLYVCGSHTSAVYGLPPSIAITDDLSAADFYVGGDLSNPRCRGPVPAGRRIAEVSRRGAVLSYVIDRRRDVPAAP